MTSSFLGGLHGLDAAILVAYLALLSGIGLYFSRRQSSLNDFIRSGRKVGWLALGVSLMASLNSGLDYIQTPAIVYGIGMVCVMSWLSWLPLYPWISRVTLPFYQRLNVYSVYEYLEQRFGLAMRLTGAAIFILWRVGWMGAAIYVPCLAVRAATGGQLQIGPMVVALGVVVTLYTVFGGMRAVIWTDVAQFCIMFGGLAATLYTVVRQIPGGFGELWRVAHETGRMDLLGAEIPDGGSLWATLGNFFTTEVTFVGIVAVVTLSRFTAFTADQISIQRFQSSGSVADSRRAYCVNALTDVVWIVVLGFVGLALLAYHRHFPLPAGMQNDQVLPNFMQHHFPHGVVGLVIAAIFAASLSSVGSALNASAAIIVVDFYNRVWLGERRPLAEAPPADQRRQVFVTRAATLVLGGLMILIGVNVGRMGEIYQAANKILGAFFGPLFGIFALGMFSRRAHSAGVFLGALAGLGSSCFASFFSTAAWLQALCGGLFGPGFVHFFNHLSWLWPSPIGVFMTLAVGYGASRILHAPARSNPPLTFAEVMRRPLPDQSAR